ncbi:hypothetical protein RB200_02570 [Streptomyces sp. PmtG]
MRGSPRAGLSGVTVATFTPVYAVVADGIRSSCPPGTPTTLRAGSASGSSPPVVRAVSTAATAAAMGAARARSAAPMRGSEASGSAGSGGLGGGGADGEFIR